MRLIDLDAPFDPNDVEWRAAQSGEANGKIWVKCLAYITNRAIMKRLDDVCGKGGWKNEYRDIPNNGGVECGISIKVGDEWITKWDAADTTNIEAVKGGRSGAMKRAAVQWGIGRYLYGLTEGWGIISDNGKLSGKTRTNKYFKWNPPALPSWAMPSKSQAASNQSGGIDADLILKKATGAMSSCDMNTLKTLFGQYHKELSQYPGHLEKLTEVKDIRKNELTKA